MFNKVLVAIATFLVVFGIAAPASAYTQGTSYPSQGTTSLYYVQVRVYYKSGAWLGYSSWKTSPTIAILTLSTTTSIQYGQHGVDSWH